MFKLTFDIPDNPKKLCKCLYQFLEDNYLSDVILLTKTQEILAHSIVLAAADCKFLKSEISKSNFSGKAKPKIDFRDYDENIIKILLRYLYTGEVELQRFDIGEFHRLSSYLGLKPILNHDFFQQFYKIDDSFKSKETSISPNKNASVDHVDNSEISVKEEVQDNDLLDENNELDETNGEILHLVTNPEFLKDQISTALESMPHNDSDSAEDNISLTEENADGSENVTESVKVENEDENTDDYMDVSEDDALIPVKKGRRCRRKKNTAADRPPSLTPKERAKSLETMEHVEEKTDSSSKKKKLECPFTDCKKFFERRYNLQRHIDTCHTEKKYECECGKTFSNKTNYIAHQQKHSHPNNFTCKYCGKMYSSRYSMLQHLQIGHNEDVPSIAMYKCKVCSKKFSQKGHLREHMFCHTKEKAFMCQRCGKSFKYIRSVARHENVCKGLDLEEQKLRQEEKYQCSQCDVVFYNKRYFKLHTESAHGQASHQCCKCGETFKWRSSLSRHIAKRCGISEEKRSKRSLKKVVYMESDGEEEQKPTHKSNKTSPRKIFVVRFEETGHFDSNSSEHNDNQDNHAEQDQNNIEQVEENFDKEISEAVQLIMKNPDILDIGESSVAVVSEREKVFSDDLVVESINNETGAKSVEHQSDDHVLNFHL